ncbi:DUF1579 domain-containing protein [Lignipirellula cremea]|uniref:DUF1579 domain-containing protein n=1 Tax=Lignipirellula cremea TaxID=2528010 RepID=A0A518DSU7_9BACT|nr:DUF1579 domain-containing protein [Lignipirellula cremea]QDU94904.1 hypothetical protein Pla8534_27120 [Lignipirellula cremea]
MHAEPLPEHQWLNRLVGSWRSEASAQMGPNEPPIKLEGTESFRSVGGVWFIGEGTGQMPGGDPTQTIMSLGYDGRQGRYVGTFLGSMMHEIWIYVGSLDAARQKLVLDTTGPNFEQDGMAQYQDIIEFISDDHRTLSSQILDKEGVWQPFMTAHYYRTA